MFRWLIASPSNRRRIAAMWQNQDVNQAAEVLEIRAVPAPLATGLYDNDVGTTVEVYPPEGKKQYAEVDVQGLGKFSAKVIPKKNGEFVIKSDSKGVKGEIKLRPSTSGDHYRGPVHFRDKYGTVDQDDEIFSKYH